MCAEEHTQPLGTELSKEELEKWKKWNKKNKKKKQLNNRSGRVNGEK